MWETCKVREGVLLSRLNVWANTLGVRVVESRIL